MLKFPFQTVGTEKVEYVQNSSVCSRKFPSDPRVLFVFQPVENLPSFLMDLDGKFANRLIHKINKSLYLSVNILSAEHLLRTLSISNWNLEVLVKSFSNSLTIHEDKTKEITTVKQV